MKPSRRVRLARKAAARARDALPRVYVCDGPARESRVYAGGGLVERRPHVWHDLSGNENHATARGA